MAAVVNLKRRIFLSERTDRLLTLFSAVRRRGSGLLAFADSDRFRRSDVNRTTVFAAIISGTSTTVTAVYLRPPVSYIPRIPSPSLYRQ